VVPSGCGGNVVVDGGSTIANGGASNSSGALASGNGGASGNLCTELANALLAASQGNGCSAFASEAMVYEAEAAHCPSNAVLAKSTDCFVGCLKQVTDCTSATQLQAGTMCASACSP
jgi:hypothetical protein